MEVILKESLVRVMQNKGLTDILVNSKHYNTWSGVVKDISARFVDRAELQQLQEWGFQRVPTQLGSLWYHPKRVVLKDRVTVRRLCPLLPKVLFITGADPV